MNVPLASQLVTEDALASRNVEYDEDKIIAEQLELEDELDRKRRSELKGKGRAIENDDSPTPIPNPPILGRSQFEVDDVSAATSRSINKRRKKREYWRNAVQNCFYIAVWYFFSTLISVYNKWMFSPEHKNFGFPLFVTSFHMVIQFCLAGLVFAIFPSFKPQTRPTPTEYIQKAAPCAVATGLDIGLSNLSLQSITLSFYTMCKSSNLGFVLLFAFFFRLERPTLKLIGIIAIITIGVILMVSAETKFSLVGMIEVLSASACGGLRWSLTQLLLNRKSMGMSNPIATLFWLCPIMAVTLGICSIIFEGPFAPFYRSDFFGSFGLALNSLALISFPGMLAFVMTSSEFMLIHRTSVVTLSVAGIFKEVATIFVSTTIFHDELTPINISGLCVALFGIALYNFLKYKETSNVGLAPETATHDRAKFPDRMSMYNRDNTIYAGAPGDSVHTIGSDSDSDSEEEDIEEGGDRVRLVKHESAHDGIIEGLNESIESDERVKRLEKETEELSREMSSPDGSWEMENWSGTEESPKDARGIIATT